MSPRRTPGSPVPPVRSAIGIVIFITALLLLMLLWRGIEMITDWYWFQELGYENVFLVTFLTQMKVGALFGAAFFFIFYLNLFLADRFSSRGYWVNKDALIHIPPWEAGNYPIGVLILLGSILFSLFATMRGSAQWENYLRFFQATPFGLSDPLFNKDIGFYVFQLPFLNYLYGWLITVLILTAIATALIYFIRRSFQFIPPRTLRIAPAARTHIAILTAAIFFVGTGGVWVELNEILFTKRGVVFGPGYADVTTQLWILKLLMGVTVFCGLSILSLVFRSAWRLPALGVAAFLAVVIVGTGIYPSLVQKFKVVPNEIVLEKPFLEQNIKYTRIAYRLNGVQDREFPAEESLTREDLRRNDLTIKNIRLWDHAPLLSTYGQLQEIRTYYKFQDVDNDRYTINGEYRQVMLSPRELSYRALPARTWINEHLTYTHGYGAVLGPVNRISREGLPEFFIKDIPPVSSANIKITRPEIYYGETSNEYVFVRTKRPEFDYPVGEKNVYSRYEGKGGVSLSFWRKLIFAARFGSLTILFSDDVTSQSRVMYYRKISERVSRVVPFVRLDPDPYLVISPEGRLFWFLDGYTVTDRFPYSEPIENLGNYIRNSVKAVVDTYDGTIQLYISDSSDPIIQTYAKIFPGLLKSLEEMPPDLRSHIRYPPGLLNIQARMYSTYHMQDAQVFYNKEDLWSIPRKSGPGGEQEMQPYYTIMRLPDGKKEEFVLLLPFTPSKKDNMSAWMAGRCDPPHYGEVVVYDFPKQKLVYGPRQIEARIDQDAEISKQLSLWNQRGSQVIRGNLLAIPIEKSILYVEPLYLAAEKGSLPELKRVIIAFGNSVAMEENLELSLQRVFGGELLREREAPRLAVATVPQKEKSDRQIAGEALVHYRKGQDFLRQGNWGGYGEELKKMEEALRNLEKSK
ncbi:MAG: UPF0182 family protein [Thermodesulfobacteriota bacterium]